MLVKSDNTVKIIPMKDVMVLRFFSSKDNYKSYSHISFCVKILIELKKVIKQTGMHFSYYECEINEDKDNVSLITTLTIYYKLLLSAKKYMKRIICLSSYFVFIYLFELLFLIS